MLLRLHGRFSGECGCLKINRHIMKCRHWCIVKKLVSFCRTVFQAFSVGYVLRVGLRIDVAVSLVGDRRQDSIDLEGCL